MKDAEEILHPPSDTTDPGELRMRALADQIAKLIIAQRSDDLSEEPSTDWLEGKEFTILLPDGVVLAAEFHTAKEFFGAEGEDIPW